ncbi:periplasmic serine protease, Do/DeqQ family protein [Mizugakiibacter sediminis]|uniref:Probable periplasmic serine endoprotease DegP-like n=1 Tax=Mizugakiibacter sediminis TaxID=1475481 RepID=A0A0K8QIU2_9GAMM|nr:DegQ family serine endoprotease [Mizugakiibacter sediminis]GAP64753.1 periplasmic serine protease, Do/DeqQ family protein [Mizugakiibacter sediminis]
MRFATLGALLLLAASAFAAGLPDFTGIVEKNGKAVVNVQATYDSRNRADAGPGPDDQVPEIFRRFFGIPVPPQQDDERFSLGSGFIISSDGYILTNNHVVDGADQVKVKLSDRREFTAKVVGTDAQYDIALLKVDASNLPTVTIGDSHQLKAGQWVVAIGSPFGFDHSVTAGIVSAVGRNFGASDQQYVPFIQTDVPINRGNSGGPLFNLDGQVVGINSQIFSNTGGYMGVSFSIPIDIAMNAVQQIKDKGYVTRGMIGVQIQAVTDALAKSVGLPNTAGAMVSVINPGGPAEKAGVKLGDVILAYNGQPIDGPADLPPLVGATRPGSKATLEIFRDGRKRSIEVTVGELPRDGKSLAAAEAAAVSGNPLGLVVQDLSGEDRRRLGLKPGEGVGIARVAGTAARRAGLQPGDVILMVGRTRIGSAAAFNDAVKGVKPGDSVMLLVRRDQATSFIAITVPKEQG